MQWDDRIIADLTLIPIPPNGGTSLAIFVAEVSLFLIERVSEGREGSVGGQRWMDGWMDGWIS